MLQVNDFTGEACPLFRGSTARAHAHVMPHGLPSADMSRGLVRCGLVLALKWRTGPLGQYLHE